MLNFGRLSSRVAVRKSRMYDPSYVRRGLGTRAATPHGLGGARDLGAHLAESGVTVVSGLAIRIDAVAHTGALAAGGAAVGVVATGLGIEYPRRHAALYARVRGPVSCSARRPALSWAASAGAHAEVGGREDACERIGDRSSSEVDGVLRVYRRKAPRGRGASCLNLPRRGGPVRVSHLAADAAAGDRRGVRVGDARRAVGLAHDAPPAGHDTARASAPAVLTAAVWSTAGCGCPSRSLRIPATVGALLRAADERPVEPSTPVARSPESPRTEPHDELDIVICTYDNPVLLDLVLTALADQQAAVDGWKVTVVDNNTREDTRAVVDRHVLEGAIPGLRWVEEPKQGLTPTRFYEVRCTTGRWIAFVVDDCVLHEPWVEHALAFARAHEDCGGLGGRVTPEYGGDPSGLLLRYGGAFAEQDFGDERVTVECLVGAGMVLNREALEESGRPRAPYFADRVGRKLVSGADVEIALRVATTRRPLWYTPECTLRRARRTGRRRHTSAG